VKRGVSPISYTQSAMFTEEQAGPRITRITRKGSDQILSV